MHILTADFSHVDTLSFNEHKSIYSKKLMMRCLQENFRTTYSHGVERTYALTKDSQGKPWGEYSDDKTSVRRLSVAASHSYPYVYSAATKESVLLGCDVEKIRNFDDFFITSFLCPRELSYYNNVAISIRDEVATKIWVIKESILKALGTGLTIHPKRLDISAILEGDTIGEYVVVLDDKRLPCRVVSLEKKDTFIFCCVGIPEFS